jgi:phosphate starvation-inducible PhoH-like protein
MSSFTHRVELDEAVVAAVFGVKDCNLRSIEAATGARLAARGATLKVTGEEAAVGAATALLEGLADLVRQGVALRPADVAVAARLVAESPETTLREVLLEQAVVAGDRKRVLPRSATQRAYIQAIRHHDIVFGIGPAGTGKTYLAVGLALQALRERAVRRIVLTRPAVEAGEKLGFLPGDLVEKVNPYLRPLHDAIHDLADGDLARTLIDRGDLEVAPLAFMRGRTLNDSFIILDEAQNTTHDQMKMFLTRMGLHSKAVVTGDITQVDLPRDQVSGLAHALSVLTGVKGIGMVKLDRCDVVRHRVVQAIVDAYEREDAARENGQQRS